MGFIENVNTVAAEIGGLSGTVAANAAAAAASEAAAAISESNALTSETNAFASKTASQLSAWQSEAERMTADSYATQLEDQFVIAYTSNGDGTFTGTPTIEYSALHYAAKANNETAPMTFTNKVIADFSNHVHANAVWYKVKALVTINKGQPIKVTGYNQGEDALEVTLANNTTGVATGLAAVTMAQGTFGAAISNGDLTDVNTSLWAEGTILYVDGTGVLTSVRPTTGFEQPIAYVLRSNANNGALQINATYPLQDAANVRFTPVGNIASTTTQAAIAELDTEKLGLSTGGIVTAGVEFQGSVTMSGPTVVVSSTTVTTADNLIVINSGEVGTGVTNGVAGIEVDRGLATNYVFYFDETDDSFKIGQLGTLQKVATREDTPTDQWVAKWDAATSKFVTFDIDAYLGTLITETIV